MLPQRLSEAFFVLLLVIVRSRLLKKAKPDSARDYSDMQVVVGDFARGGRGILVLNSVEAKCGYKTFKSAGVQFESWHRLGLCLSINLRGMPEICVWGEGTENNEAFCVDKNDIFMTDKSPAPEILK